ncbi:redoxin domain-containing protein [Roseivirga sp.]|uniref:redoxin domain-containing protein n=1 Tax=Roseivirga sp. TaxID=1964215 RepID=UPI003B8C6BD3
MRNIIVLLILVGFITACGSTSDGLVKITGKIENAIPQGEVILEKYEQGRITPITTVYSDHKGNFEIEVPVESPSFYRINVYGQQFETIVLNNEDLKIEAEGDGGSYITVSGSRDSENIEKLYEFLGDYQDLVVDFNQRYMNAKNTGNLASMETLTEEGMNLEKVKIDRLKNLAWEFDGSLVSLLIVDYIPNKADEYNFLDSLVTKLKKEVPTAKDVDYFAESLPFFKPAVSIGEIAPEITLPKPDGENLSLSELKGKYVLLDFWAGWCKPCRAENPNVVNMYNKYHEKGFDVFSVSLDRARGQWLDAIEKDGLIWPNHVSDVKYFQSQAAIDYKVNAIPFALLLDPEGRVIGKNLRGRMLQKKLESIFGE